MAPPMPKSLMKTLPDIMRVILLVINDYYHSMKVLEKVYGQSAPDLNYLEEENQKRHREMSA